MFKKDSGVCLSTLTQPTERGDHLSQAQGQYSDHDVKGQTFVSDKEAEEADITRDRTLEEEIEKWGQKKKHTTQN